MNRFLNILQAICYTLIITGAINWGLIGGFDFNLVEYLFGTNTYLTKGIYIAVGIAAIISVILTIRYTLENRDY